MSNDVTTPEGGTPVANPAKKRRVLWVATSVAGLTGVVGLAALGGLAATDDPATRTETLSGVRSAPAPHDATGERGGGENSEERAGDDHDSTDRRDARDDTGSRDGLDDPDGRNRHGDDNRDSKDLNGRDRDSKDRNGKDVKDRDGKNVKKHARKVPCDADALLKAVVHANNDQGGILDLAHGCTYTLTSQEHGNAFPPITQPITLTGDKTTLKRDTEKAFRFFTVTHGGHLTLKGLTLTNGHAAAHRPHHPRANDNNGIMSTSGNTTTGRDHDRGADGGALLVQRGGTAHIEATTFTNNHAHGNGGAIANAGKTTLDHSTVKHNTAHASGGGIANTGLLTVHYTHTTHNTAGHAGGGIATTNHHYPAASTDANPIGHVEITASTIANNNARHHGGGLSATGGYLDITSTRIADNTSHDDGGGIYTTGTLALHHATITHNTTHANGGGIATSGNSTTTSTATAITHNTASGHGGGIHHDTKKHDSRTDNRGNRHDHEPTLTLRYTTIATNTAANGAGVYNSHGTITLTATTVTDNTATGHKTRKHHQLAGGIFNDHGKVIVDHKTSIIGNEPTNCAGTVPACHA